MLQKTILSICLAALVLSARPGLAQEAPLQWDIAAGVHTYHLPGMGAAWSPSGTAVYAGALHSFNGRQSLGLSLRLGYARDKYQGDAVQAQLMFMITPVIAKHIELGMGLGAGYQLSFYPSAPLRWDGGNWVRGKSFKGLFHAPVQLSLGYRSFQALRYEWRPYVAYQVNALFGYSPDLSLLPVSNAMIGVRVSPRKSID